MKKGILILLLALSFTSVKPQAAQAPNWTKTDCNGNSRTLYNYLDSNKVVALVFGMGCSSCVDAVSYFSGLKTQYAISYPGRFKALYLDFFAGNTCATNVLPVLSTSNFDGGFDNCAAELANYTSATPMTFVVVTAGTAHSIIYSIKKNIFDFADSVAIKTAIDNFLSIVSVKELKSTNESFSVYPNPANEILNLRSEIKNGSDAFKISIYNSLGQVIKHEDLTFDNNNAIINTKELPSGVYVLKLSSKLFNSAQSNNSQSVSKRFVIAR